MKKNIKIQKKKLKISNPKLKEECGIFGISNTKDASALTALGLHALQHRGQEGCGIVTFNGEQYFSEKYCLPLNVTIPHPSCPLC